MDIIYSSVSEQGGRPYNEDCVGCCELPGRSCFVLADGLGGHGMGDIASRLAVDSVLDTLERGARADIPLLGAGFENAQSAIMARQEELSAGCQMKTTAVALCVERGRALFGHIGDSRLYFFHGGKAARLTSDHSVPQMLVASGEITEEEIRRHPDRNRLLRVLGAEWTRPQPYALCKKPLHLRRGDAFLLCSDGFWEYILESEMGAALALSDTPEKWLSQMSGLVQKNGENENMDNYSAIAVMVR